VPNKISTKKKKPPEGDLSLGPLIK